MIILIDLWDTILKKPYKVRKILFDHFKIGLSIEEGMVKYEKSVQLKDYEDEQELATDFLNEFDIEINKENIDFVIKTLKEAGEKSFFIEGMDDFLNSLQKHDLYLVSNTSNIEFKAVKEKISKYFKKMFPSYELGMKKPENLKYFIGKVDLFIDDQEGNIVKAREFGIKSIQFKNSEELKKIL